MEKINAIEEHVHLFSRHLANLGFLQGPRKLVPIKALHPQAESVLIPVQDLQRTPPRAAEHVKVSIQRVLVEFLAYEDRERIDLFSHIRVSGSDVDSYPVPGYSHNASLTARIIRLNTSCDIASGNVKRIPPSYKIAISRLGLSAVSTRTNLDSSCVSFIRFFQKRNVESGIRSVVQNSRKVRPLLSHFLTIFAHDLSFGCCTFHLRTNYRARMDEFLTVENNRLLLFP
jgi:hypothetical protein